MRSKTFTSTNNYNNIYKETVVRTFYTNDVKVNDNQIWTDFKINEPCNLDDLPLLDFNFYWSGNVKFRISHVNKACAEAIW